MSANWTLLKEEVDVLGKLSGGLIAPRRLLLQSLEHDQLEITGERTPEPGWCGCSELSRLSRDVGCVVVGVYEPTAHCQAWALRYLLGDRRVDLVSFEGRKLVRKTAREQLVEENTELVHICRCCREFAEHLLRTRVPHNLRIRARRLLSFLDHAHFALRADHDPTRCKPAIDDTMPMPLVDRMT
jgi:hypothetical protein